MIRIIFVILTLILSLNTFSVAESGITAEKILENIKKAEKNIKSISFSYRQEIFYTLTDEIQTSQGNLIFSKPDKIYIKQKEPLEQSIITNGKKVWVYTPGFNQVIEDKWKKWIKNSMVPSSLLNFAKNWDDFKRKYNIIYLEDDEIYHVMLLEPKKKDLWKIKFWVNTKTFVSERMMLLADNIEIKVITVSIKMNPNIDKNIFDFRAPSGVEKIKF